MASNWLLNEPPLLVMPSLACAVGLDEAIVLQQLHYWLQKSDNVRDGKRWVYNTNKEWKDQFPFWSEEAIRRTMRKLRDLGLVVTANYNNMPMDRTLWYTIDYDKLNTICRNDDSMCSESPDASGQNRRSNNQRLLPENNNSFGCSSSSDQTPGKFVVTEAQTAAVYKCWMDNMPGSMTPILQDQIHDWLKEYGPAPIIAAITAAVQAGVRKPNYVNGILVKQASGEERQPKPKKETYNYNYGTNRKADTSSNRAYGSAEAEYELPAQWQ